MFKKRVGNGNLPLTGSGEKPYGSVNQVFLQTNGYVHAGDYARLHQGVCSLPINRSRITQWDDKGEVHVVERGCLTCTLQWSDTEKPVCPIPHQPNMKEREYLTEYELQALMTYEFGDANLRFVMFSFSQISPSSLSRTSKD